MASKFQLGRLRQWAGEVISSREKVLVDDEFVELEKDVQLRREGIQRLMTASEAYQQTLSKKKASEALSDEDKMLPIDSLGLVMIGHGEEFGEDSSFGRALIKLGRAHCKIATLQEAFALTFKDTFITSMERFKDEIKEYESLKKKLENRRTIYDSATAKFEKLQNSNSKKEKDRREAEDELERARQRYDETAEDMRAHMHAIQENEHKQHQELSEFLDLETNFIQSYLDILKDVKADWHGRSNSKRSSTTNSDSRKIGSSRPVSRSSFVYKNGKDRVDSTNSTGDSSDEGGATAPAYSRRHSKSGSMGSRPPSRPASRLSRKRKDSVAASTSASDDKEKDPKDKDKEKEKDKEKPTTERTRSLSVTGWASSAVESLTGGGGGTSKKSKDTEAFAALDDSAATKTVADQQGEDTTPGNHKVRKSSSFRSLTGRSSSGKNKSKENLPATTSSPRHPPKILKPLSLQDNKRVVRALYDFSGSSDELSFKAGSEIVVVNEVLDDWWMGEMNGQQGLFPASYTAPLGSKQAVAANGTKNIGLAASLQSGLLPNDHEDSDNDHYLMSDADDEHIIRAMPMAANKSPVFYGAFNDTASFADSAAEDEDDFQHPHSHLHPYQQQQQTLAVPMGPPALPVRRPIPDEDNNDNWFSTNESLPTTTKRTMVLGDSAQQPLINRSQSAEATVHLSQSQSQSQWQTNGTNATPTKKIPPPPPPRRVASHNPTATPPVPERRIPPRATGASSGAASVTSNSSFNSLSSLSANGHGQGQGGDPAASYDRSPFDSAVELGGEDGGGADKCQNFRQNPFKPRGMCSNCLEFHQ